MVFPHAIECFKALGVIARVHTSAGTLTSSVLEAIPALLKGPREKSPPLQEIILSGMSSQSLTHWYLIAQHTGNRTTSVSSLLALGMPAGCCTLVFQNRKREEALQ